MEDFINHLIAISSYLCDGDFNSMPMKEKTEKQKMARQLVSDYSRFLFSQEKLVEQIVDRKWQELLPYIEAFIDKKVQEQKNS